MTSAEQLERWVAGEPIHNHDREECCPDFSCCRPQLLAPLAVRRAFLMADEKTRERMLFGFLAAALPLMTERAVYVAGTD
jgi:hypothetical protein